MENKKYTIVLCSNFMNHYQLALSKELMEYFEHVYFVVFEELPEERKKMGFQDMNSMYDFVVEEYKDPQRVQELFDTADLVITDWNLRKYYKNRLKSNKITFYHSERIFKQTGFIWTLIRKLGFWYMYHGDKKGLMLCISAYTAEDYRRCGVFKNRAYKWGYFPPTVKHKNIEELISEKKKNSLVWAGRLINWKHPDDAITLAKRLKDDGYDFELNIVGNGEMENELKQMIKDLKLESNVKMLGSMPPEKVREVMEQSEVYLFTSDRGEGWGVVLNEAMNSACVCIADKDAGSTKFLIKDDINGYMYDNGDLDTAYKSLKSVLDNQEKKHELELNSYNTIINDWGVETAAKRLFDFFDLVNNNNNPQDIYVNGILSISE